MGVPLFYGGSTFRNDSNHGVLMPISGDLWPLWLVVLGHLFLIPSGYVKIAIENGPVEIVDFPSYKMVDLSIAKC